MMPLFRLFLLLIVPFVLTGCINSEEKLPEITIQMASSEPTPTSLSDKLDPHWPDQELLLQCIIEWNGTERSLSTRYDPAEDYWHSKKILIWPGYFKSDSILPDDRHWIIEKYIGSDENSWPLFSYSLNHKLEEIPIEIDPSFFFMFIRIHSSYEQPSIYLMEQLVNEGASHYWWIDVNECHARDCQFQALELGNPSSRRMQRNFWSPDFKYLFMSEDQDQAAHLILTDHNELLLYDFGNKFGDRDFPPIWLNSTTFGLWSESTEHEDSVFYYGSVNDGELHPLFTKSEILSLLPISPTTWTNRTYPIVNATVGENQFIVSFIARYYDEPEPNNVYNLIINYDQSTGEFDVLRETFGEHGQYLSPDRTKIYVSTDYYSRRKTYNGSWQVIDLLSGEISVTNWLPFNPMQNIDSSYRDLSYDTEWRVNFKPVIQDADQTNIASPQPDSRQMLFINKNGFEKTIEYPEGISNCSGGWVFK